MPGKKRWGTEEGRADWVDAHPEVVALMPELKAGGSRSTSAAASDAMRCCWPTPAWRSRRLTAVKRGSTSCARPRRRGVSRSVSNTANADVLPYPDASFDDVLWWNVIYHGTLGDSGGRIAEIWRVVKPGGLDQGTMPPTRHSDYGVGRLIAPGTFVIGGAEERNHPHFYCDAATLVALSSGFELLSLSRTQ